MKNRKFNNSILKLLIFIVLLQNFKVLSVIDLNSHMIANYNSAGDTRSITLTNN